MTIRLNTILFVLYALVSCKSGTQSEMPNVILIMADDMGHECLGSYGSEYQTPVLDSLASRGVRFTNAISQPLCTPTRVKVMTGLRNFRNYSEFEYLARDQRTLGHLMKDAGYATLIAGKWQLNGLVHNKPDAKDNTTPYHFGFDEYSLWQLTIPRTRDTERYAFPMIEKNGEALPQNPDAYGPDMFVDHIVDFIDRNQDEPFFVYYPMVLVHDPFVPTPDSKDWENPELRYRDDTTYFREMVSYADKMVGRIVRKLEQLELSNTIIIFTGDNGTHPKIFTKTDHGIIQGDKGHPTDGGTKVPLIISWSSKMKTGRVSDGLVEFSDFFATLAELTGKSGEDIDGISFLNVINGESETQREEVMVYYDPKWGSFSKTLFVRDKRYKLYWDGRFFDLDHDRLEDNVLSLDSLSNQVKATHLKLLKEFGKVSDQKIKGLSRRD